MLWCVYAGERRGEVRGVLSVRRCCDETKTNIKQAKYIKDRQEQKQNNHKRACEHKLIIMSQCRHYYIYCFSRKRPLPFSPSCLQSPPPPSSTSPAAPPHPPPHILTVRASRAKGVCFVCTCVFLSVDRYLAACQLHAPHCLA